MAFRVITTALTCLWTSEKIRIGLTGPIQDLGKFLKKKNQLKVFRSFILDSINDKKNVKTQSYCEQYVAYSYKMCCYGFSIDIRII